MLGLLAWHVSGYWLYHLHIMWERGIQRFFWGFRLLVVCSWLIVVCDWSERDL